MKTENFYRRMFFLAIPIILQEMVNSAINLLDTFMIGKLGLAEYTSVGLANQMFFLFILLTFGINSGSSILMGQFWGKGDVHSIKKVMGTCFFLTSLAALIFALPCIFAPEFIMNIYSDKDLAVIGFGSEYLRIVAFSYFITAFASTINISLKSIGQTKLPMITTIVALSCNAVLNYIFIFIFHLGVAGAAYATLAARAIELILQLVLVSSLKIPIFGGIKDYFKADKRFVASHLKLAYPVILNEFLWALGVSAYHIAFKFTGTEGQGAVQISNTIQNLFFVVGLGVGSASGIMLANALGAGERDEAISMSRKALIGAIGLSVCCSVLLIVTSPFIINIFNVSDEVKGMARTLMYIVAFGIIIKTYNFTAIVGILRSGGDTMFCLIVDAITVWIVGVPLAFLGGYVLRLPIHWVFLMVYGEEIVKFFLSFRRVNSNVWAKNVVEGL